MSFEPELQCPKTSDAGVPCGKPMYRSSGGEIWDHAGGHIFASRETLERLNTWHYDASALLSMEFSYWHAPEDCPGPEECMTARLGLKP